MLSRLKAILGSEKIFLRNSERGRLKLNKGIRKIINNYSTHISSFGYTKKRKESGKAMAIIEYGVLIALIGVSMVISFVYIKTANQGRLMKDANALGIQFSPSHSNLVKSTHSFSHTRRTFQFNGEVKDELLEDEYTKTSYTDSFSGVSLKQENLWE